MDSKFYSHTSFDKKRLLEDDNLDTKEFDFMQNFASDIDELQVRSPGHAEKCLRVVNRSSGKASRLIRPVSELRDA